MCTEADATLGWTCGSRKKNQCSVSALNSKGVTCQILLVWKDRIAMILSATSLLATSRFRVLRGFSLRTRI